MRAKYTDFNLKRKQQHHSPFPTIPLPIKIKQFKNSSVAQKLAIYNERIAFLRSAMEPVEKIKSKPRKINPFQLATDANTECKAPVRVLAAPLGLPVLIKIAGRDDNPFQNSFSMSPDTQPEIPHIKQTVTREMQFEFVSKLWKSSQEILDIQQLDQRSEGWFAAREGRISGSIISNITEENPFTKQDKLLREKLWGGFNGNEATRYGTWMEPVAEHIHMISVQADDPGARMQFPGLIINESYPWLSYSPDGLITFSDGVTSLCEIKCPFKKRFYEPKRSGDANIPIYYRAQIQYGMLLLGLGKCEFLVWTPEHTKIETYLRDDGYCAWMIQKVNQFYFNRYLPALVAKQNGWLPDGVGDASTVCHIEYITKEEALATKPKNV